MKRLEEVAPLDIRGRIRTSDFRISSKAWEEECQDR
jgi:hypothetical protein